MPHLLGIGAQRAGSTWLHAQLKAHGGVWLPPVKEIHYFDRVGQPHGVHMLSTSARWRRQFFGRMGRDVMDGDWSALRWDMRYFLTRRDDPWYLGLFPEDAAVTADITPAYSTLEASGVAHVRALVPDARVLMILRDPIERAWSHAIKGLVYAQGRNFGQILEREFIAHFESEASILRGDYARTLRLWRDAFPDEAIMVGYMEQVVDAPDALLARVLAHVGLPVPVDAASGRGEAVNAKARGRQMPASLAAHLAKLYLPRLEALQEIQQDDEPYIDQWIARARALAE